jgi:hypothetical protein
MKKLVWIAFLAMARASVSANPVSFDGRAVIPFIKLVSSAPFLQGPQFVGFGWRGALAASMIGNAASYFVWLIGSCRPWFVNDLGDE